MKKAEEKTIAEAIAALRSGAAGCAVRLMQGLGPVADLGEGPLHVLGLALIAAQNWAEAEVVFQRALALRPDHPPFLFNLALTQEKRGGVDLALDHLERCVALGLKTGDVFGNLSNLYRECGRLVEAEAAAQQALDLGAYRAGALNALALARSALGGEADALWAEALSLEPQNAFFWVNRANAAVDLGLYEQAFRFFERARALDDNPAFRRDEGMARMLAGQRASGAALYEARLEVPGAFHAPVVCPRYTGQDLTGKVLLLLSEQGFGDTIQFCRYGARLAASGASLIWMVQKPLVPLLAGQLPGRVMERSAVYPAADYYLPLGSTPLLLGDAEGAAYLKAPPDGPVLAGAGPKIGLVWAGSKTHRRDVERSLPLAALAPFWDALPQALFAAPFLGEGLAQISSLSAPVRDLSGQISDFADTARWLAQMDAVVSVDTAVAHLAGALGIKVWLLLPKVPDWRWGTAGEATGLYASMRLCRQDVRGNWQGPVQQALSEIRGML